MKKFPRKFTKDERTKLRCAIDLHEWHDVWMRDPRTISCGFKYTECIHCHKSQDPKQVMAAFDSLASAQYQIETGEATLVERKTLHHKPFGGTYYKYH